MDINALASEFGSEKKADSSADPKGIDIHGLASEFGSKEKADEVKNLKRVYINTATLPPISGATPEESDRINAESAAKPNSTSGPTPRDLLPKTNIAESAYNADQAGKGLVSSGVEDLNTGHPYTGTAKIIGGGVARLMSPVSGILEGGIATPVTDLTGNPDIGDRAAFVAGSALPVAPASKAVVNAIPANKALNTLIENIGEKNLPAVVSAMKSNPRLAPVDLSPRVLQDAQHLFTSDGSQIDHLANTSAARVGGSKAAVESAVDSSLGTTVNAVDKLKELKQNIRAVGNKEINPIIAAKPHTDITSVIHDIDNEIGKPALKAFREGQNSPLIDDTKRALYELRNKLRGDWPDRDRMFSYTDQLHATQSKLRETAEALKNSSGGQERLLSGKLFEYREKLKDAIGPEYKAALGKYKDEIDIQNAFSHGHDSIITNGKAMENRPEFFKDWVAKASPEELNAAKEGARVAIDTQINGFKHSARRGTDVGQVEFNKNRIEALFGKEDADKLFTKLEHERAIANTHNKIVEGSQTAMRTASKSQFTLPTATEVGSNMLPAAVLEAGNVLAHGTPGVGTALLIGAHGVAAAKDAAKMALAKAHNLNYAKYALPTEGPDREALIKALENRIPGPKKSILNRTSNALSSVIGP